MTRREWRKFYEHISPEAKAERREGLLKTINRLECIQKQQGTKFPAAFVVQLAKTRAELEYLDGTTKEAVA